MAAGRRRRRARRGGRGSSGLRPRGSTPPGGAGGRSAAAPRSTPRGGRRRRFRRGRGRRACCRCGAWRRRDMSDRASCRSLPSKLINKRAKEDVDPSLASVTWVPGLGRKHRICQRAAEHPLHPLARHRPLRAAVRACRSRPRTSSCWPTRGSSSARPSARPDLLRQPRQPADRPLLPQQRHARARPPRLGAQRLRPALGPCAAPGRLPLDPDRGAAHLQRPGGDRLRRDRPGRLQPGRATWRR